LGNRAAVVQTVQPDGRPTRLLVMTTPDPAPAADRPSKSKTNRTWLQMHWAT